MAVADTSGRDGDAVDRAGDAFDAAAMLDAIRRIHHIIRARLIEACEAQSLDELRGTAAGGAGDFIYAIDRVSETELVGLIDTEIAAHVPVLLIGEGIGNGSIVLPAGTSPDAVRWRLIVDPIDGTRGLMYQKRSAWILTGAARERGLGTRLADIEIAVQTEIPLVKQHLADSLWALDGEATCGERWNRLDGTTSPLVPAPSRATDFRHGFATVCRFFPGARDVLASIDDRLVRELLGPARAGEALVFEDQYACTGGQIYGLIIGQDRFVADLRPLMAPILEQRGDALGQCCHPYDLCTWLVARQAGVEVTDATGNALDSPLDTHANIAWIGYANRSLRERVEPLLLRILEDLPSGNDTGA